MWNIRGAAWAVGTLTVEVHVPGIVAILVLPDSLADGADQRDGQQAAKQHQDLKVGDPLHVGQLQRRPSGILGNTWRDRCGQKTMAGDDVLFRDEHDSSTGRLMLLPSLKSSWNTSRSKVFSLMNIFYRLNCAQFSVCFQCFLAIRIADMSKFNQLGN